MVLASAVHSESQGLEGTTARAAQALDVMQRVQLKLLRSLRRSKVISRAYTAKLAINCRV